jgi:thioredoxin-related protein
MKNILLILLFTFQLYATQIFWYDSYKDAQEESIDTGKPMLIFMSQEGCGSCEYMEDIVLVDDEVSEYIDKHYIAAHLDIHANDAPMQLQIPVTPVFHFLNSDGSELKDAVIGGKKASRFLKAIKLNQ